MTYLIPRQFTDSVEYKITEELFNSADRQLYAGPDRSVKQQASYLDDLKQTPKFKDAVPLGDIPNISEWLEFFYGKKMQPIEAPKILRRPEFLNRNYTILQARNLHGLLQDKQFFIKNCSKLKAGSCNADVPTALKTMFTDIKETDWFVISDIVDVQSEWRVYVIDEKIVNICNYDGKPDIMPDVNVIKKMMAMYHTVNHPKSYVLDVMLHDGKTSILEIQPFCAVGLYSTLWDRRLLLGYKQGIQWYLNNNYHFYE